MEMTVVVGKDKLFGEVCKNADAVKSCLNHEIDTAPLAFKIRAAVLFEDRRYNWKYATKGRLFSSCSLQKHSTS